MRREIGSAVLAGGGSLRSRASRLGPNLIGILAMTGACACFVLNDTFTKLARETLETGQLLALRGLIASIFCLLIAHAVGALRAWRALFHPLILIRSLIDVAISFAFITALGHLPLANISAILQSVPLLVTALAAILLGAKVGWRRWSAIVVGFVGVLMVVQPGPSGFDFAALLALASAFGVAARDLLTRRIAAGVPSLLVALCLTVIVGLSGLASAPFSGPWIAPSTATWTHIAGAAAAYTVGNLLIVIAMRTGEISVTSPFRYSIMLFAPILGVIVWGDVPNALAFAGGGLVIAAGLYTIRREAIRAREGRNDA